MSTELACLLLACLGPASLQQPDPLPTTENRVGGGWVLRLGVPAPPLDAVGVGSQMALAAGPKGDDEPHILLGIPHTMPSGSTYHMYMGWIPGGVGRLKSVRMSDGFDAFMTAGLSDEHLGYSPGVIHMEDSPLARNFALGVGTNVYQVQVNWLPFFPPEFESVRGSPALRVYNRLGDPVWSRGFGLPDGVVAPAALRHRWTGRPMTAANVGDVNQDGWDDIMLGVPGLAPNSLNNDMPIRSLQYLVSGEDGATLAESYGLHWRYGYGVFGLGDIDADQAPDVAVSRIPNFGGVSAAGAEGENLLYVISFGAGLGTTSFDLKETLSPPGGDDSGFGAAVLGRLFLDADLKPDFVVSAPAEQSDGVPVGALHAYSGADLSLLWSYQGAEEGASLGARLTTIPDLNGDGRLEIVACDVLNGRGGFQVISSVDGSLLMHCREAEATGLGAGLVSLGDADGNGMPSLALGAPGYGGFYNFGWIGEYELDPYVELSADSLSVSAGDSLTVDLDFPPSENDRKYYVFLSAAGTGPYQLESGVWVPLSNDPLLQSLIDNTPPPWVDNVVSQRAGPLDSEGKASFTLTAIPGLSSLEGQTLHVAVVSLDPAPDNTPRISTMARGVAILP